MAITTPRRAGTPLVSGGRLRRLRIASVGRFAASAVLVGSVLAGGAILSSASAAAASSTGLACATPNQSSQSRSSWAQLRLSPAQAWTRSRGADVTVAVLDSGVDGSLSELASHVTEGVDVTTGLAGADTDCVGHGTAIAGMIAAQPHSVGGGDGLAPDSKILPVRVRNSSGAPSASVVARGIDVAVSAGAHIVVMPYLVDLDQSAMRTAVQNAVKHNVLVVTNAAPASRSSSAAQANRSGVLRVGGVSIDGAVAQAYQSGSVDVVAPGVDVSVLGINGIGVFSATGTEYAVGFVAGLAALVRSAFPKLTAAQVVHRIEATATRLSTTLPDPQFGWGFIDPLAAGSRTLAEETAAPTASGSPNVNSVDRAATTRSSSPDGRTLALWLAVGVGVLAVLAIGLRVRRWVTDGGPTERNERDDDEHAAAHSR
jgi:membrane-anchored mycosin MYCP